MSRPEAWFHQLANLLVAATGLAWAWTLWWCEPADEFALVNHPLQPWFQAGHLWTAPLLVFSAGLLWREHAWRRLRRGGRGGRRSGLALMATLAPMVASGFFLQTAAEESGRRLWLAVHLTASALWLLSWVGHQLRRLGRRRP
ncbi:MAG: hypothetical protein D6702_07040 [Planctomycetota bacterium]|nr:MAG: hypothetical protein D6702_07040 [Planctomycetota bacterium]